LQFGWWQFKSGGVSGQPWVLAGRNSVVVYGRGPPSASLVEGCKARSAGGSWYCRVYGEIAVVEIISA